MFGWTRTASDVESTTNLHDRPLVNGHAKIDSWNAVSLKVSRTQYSGLFHEFHEIGYSLIRHGRSLLNVVNYI